jgi:Tol biopolymer transport system component
MFLTTVLWNRDDPPPVSLTHRPVTTTNNWDSGASWSADGKFIAFDRMTSGHFDIYIKAFEGGQEVARVVLPGDQGTPRWAPDGRLLAYISNDPGSPVFLVPPDGGNARELIATNLPALSGDQRVIMGGRPWSADGKSLLVSRSVDGRQFAVHRVDRDSGESEQLTFPPTGSDDSAATYSFDHKRVLFRRGNLGSFGRFFIMAMPADGGDPKILYEDTDIVGMAWRPDNRHVVVQKTKSLLEIDIVTRKTRQLASFGRRVQGLSVSGDDRIVYADFWHDQFLYVVDVATGERTQITFHAGNNGGARFSPDGRTIAYASNRNGIPQIWLHPTDGRPEAMLADDGSKQSEPEWSPDGKRVVFRSDREGGVPKLFVASTDAAGGIRLLVDQPIRRGMNITSVAVHRWAPDGALIAYPVDGNDGRELWTVDPDGEGARKRLDGVVEFDWYRDSRRALVTRQRGSETELSVVDLDSGQERVLFVGALREIDVAPDGSAVAFCFGRGHFSMGLAVLKLDNPTDPSSLPTAIGVPEYVVPTEGTWHIHNGGWSPDSRELVYTHDQDYGDIYEAVENR